MSRRKSFRDLGSLAVHPCLIRACLLAFLTAMGLPLKSSAGFIAAPSYSVGTNPVSVVMADLNGDGILDLAVANAGTEADSPGSVSILLGKADGTFPAAQNYATGSSSRSVVVADFNGDGILDLAVANAGSGNISILLGNGDGTFQTARNHVVGNAPVSVAVGDFNSDGNLDLAVAGAGPENQGLIILLGNGDGSFHVAPNPITEIYPWSVTVADFNGDGRLDLVVAYNSLPGIVGILLGNGDGSFQPAVDYSVGGLSTSVAVADFNGDGILDLAVANLNAGTVSVLLGNGDGSFQANEDYNASGGAVSVAAGDFNADGHLDLVVAGETGVSFLLGTGDGKFLPGPSFAPVPLAAQTVTFNGLLGGFGIVAVGDLNADGILDLALATLSSGTVSVLIGKGQAAFQAAPSYAIGPGVSASSLAVADFNGDGISDLAVANASGINDPGTVTILLGNGDGSFQAAQGYATARGAASAIAAADLNGDGIPDLIIGIYGNAYDPTSTIVILLGRGDGTFEPPHSYPGGSGVRSLAVGDFNGDGKIDIVTTNFAQQFGSRAPGPILENDVRVYLGNGDGSLQRAHTYPAGQLPQSVAVGDFNGDGALDLAVANEDSRTVSILLGKGDGTFGPPENYAIATGANTVAAGDFNGDGQLDLAVVGDAGVSLLLGSGDGTFLRTPIEAAGGSSIAVGDFNSDGASDLAVGDSSGTLTILLGNGNATFLPARTSVLGTRLAHIIGVNPAVRDFNGDGFPDLAVGNGGTVTILVNDANWPP